jgi:ribosomal protein S18 acetylase RimI-like enzyme
MDKKLKTCIVLSVTVENEYTEILLLKKNTFTWARNVDSYYLKIICLTELSVYMGKVFSV